MPSPRFPKASVAMKGEATELHTHRHHPASAIACLEVPFCIICIIFLRGRANWSECQSFDLSVVFVARESFRRTAIFLQDQGVWTFFTSEASTSRSFIQAAVQAGLELA